ncbi:MAG: PAS domain S-box protein [candidate division Zixibacteria bacterium]|nr:PAS domain S-box protein [candidate division Zixibacteria bacterium]
MVETIKEKELIYIKKYVSERAQRERMVFAQTEEYQKAIKSYLLNRLEIMGDQDPVEQFNQLFRRYPDGVIRKRIASKKGDKVTLAYINESIEINADIRRRMVLFEHVAGLFGPAFYHQYPNLYIISEAETMDAAFWPDQADWNQNVGPEFDMTTHEFAYVSNKINNPERKTVWTGLYYDVSGIWMVSCSTPVDYKGRHIGSIGQDIYLNELVKRSVDDHLEGAYNMIFRRDGRLIVHPDQIEVSQKKSGIFNIQTDGDKSMKTIFNVVTKDPDKQIFELDEPDVYLAVARIEGPDWFFVVVYPKSVIAKAAIKTSLLALLVGFFAVILVFIVLHYIIRQQIGIPLKNLTAAVNQVASGESDVTLPIGRNDEYGLLARSFNTMIERVQELINGLKDRIIEREKAEKALKESEQRYRILFDSAPVGIISSTTDGKIVAINEAFQLMTGYSQTELLSIYTEQLYENLSDREKLVTRVFEEGIVHDYKTTLIRKNGEHFRTRLTTAYETLEDLPVFLTVIEDITAREQAKKELNRVQKMLGNIINSMPSILVGINQDGKVKLWNNEAERITGIRTQEAQGRHLSSVLPQFTKNLGIIQIAIDDKQSQKEERIPFEIKGEKRYSDITAYPLTTNVDEQHVVIRVDDITERIRMEELMIQSEKMLSVGGLAAGMAHEINNPLAGMMQTAHVVRNRLTNIEIPANEYAAKEANTTIEAISTFMETRGIPKMLKAINESGQRVAEIVDNMLSFARKSEAMVSSQDLENLLDKTLELAATDYDLKKQYDFKMIEVKKEYEESLPPVQCEGAKIQQVLLNILRNGAQAMQESGTEKPRFVIRTQFEKERQMICMEIEDNGLGMDEETRKRAFEPFFTTKPTGEGTGLGLSVSYFIIVENHKGELAVESNPGAGTKFIIRLPLDRENARSQC